ncbi:MAG: MotA/TolQ/ExbB proton channel family protein [Kiritimatiellia bacterium]
MMRRHGMMVVLGMIGWMVCASGHAGSSTDAVARAIASLQADIQRDTAALLALRAEIGAAREPLAQELAALQEEAAGLRAEMERLQRMRQQGEQDQARLQQRAAIARESYQYAETLVTEYARSLDTRVGVTEAVVLVDHLTPIRDQFADVGVEEFPVLVAQLLALAEEWNTKRLGGHVVAGVALDAEGLARAGSFAVFGPVAFFAADAADTAGIALPRLGRLEPGMHPLERAGARAVHGLLAGAAAHIPTDVTGGDAIRIEQSRVTIVARLRKGGFVMIPLLLTGLVALLLAVWKAVALGCLHHAVNADLGELPLLLQRGDIAQVQALLSGVKAPLADIVQEAVAHRDTQREHLEEILHEHVVGVLPQAERHLGTLAVLGGVAPLLGLLGTVTGMIHTFQLVTLFGSGDARMLSGGISEALITTETGLVIAVPVLLVQAFLARGARSAVATLERQALTLVNHLHARGNVR